MSADETLQPIKSNGSTVSAKAEHDALKEVEVEPQQGAGKHGKERQESRSRKWPKVLLIVVLALVLIGGLLAAAFALFVNSGKEELLADNDQSSLRKSIFHNGTTYNFNEDMVTIAIVGTDRGTGSTKAGTNGSADAIILIAYDTATGKIALVNIPRNVVTPITFYYGDDDIPETAETFIASAYSLGDDDADGAEIVCNAASDLFRGIPIENYVAMLEGCIGPLTEAMGGVTLTAVGDVGYMGIKKGETYTLMGEQALRYVQFRDTSQMTSPLDRIERQKDFMKAFVSQTKEAVKKDPSILGKFYDIVTDPQYMTTNLHMNELAYLAWGVMTGSQDLEMLTVACDEEYDAESRTLAYYPRQDELVDLILSVYYEPAEQS